MDSVTQFALGACIGAASLGPRIGARKAALVGGLLGTVPDLDVFYPLENPIDSFTLHRGPTHSLFIQALATPLFAESILRLFKGFREGPGFWEGGSAGRLRVYLGVYLIFVTHSMIDAITIYGTKIFWPLIPEPLGLGSMFIIDPIYSIPLVVMTFWALVQSKWGPRIARALAVSLIFTTAYMGWSLIGQQIAERRAIAYLGGLNEGARILTLATPFNTVFWKTILVQDDEYRNIYIPLLGGAEDITEYRYARNWESLACAHDVPGLEQVDAFSDGFIRLERAQDNRIQIADLRMGLTPNYVFRFTVADAEGQEIFPERDRPARQPNEGDFTWLVAGIAGAGLPRQIEAQGLSRRDSC